MTDHDLIQRHLRDGSPDGGEALNQLVSRHLDMVHAAARRQVSDPALAEDITQAVFLLLVRRARHLPHEISIAGWLYKTTWFVAAEMRRQHHRRQRRESESVAMKTPPATTSENLSQEDLTALHAAIARLPSADRNAIVLHYLEGRPSAEAAAALNTSDAALRTRLTRAKDRLRKLLARAGVTLSAAALAVALESSKAHAAPTATLTAVQSLLQGAAPAAHIQSLVSGVLEMTLRTKIITAAIVLAVVGILGYLTFQLASPKPTPEVIAATTLSATPAAAPTPAATALTTTETPKSLIQGAYRDALAGNEAPFLARWATLSDDGKLMPISNDQKRTLLAVVRVMHAFDTLLTAVGEKFGAETRTQLAQQVPLSSDPKDIENASATPTDDNNVIIDLGKTGPGKVRTTRINSQWYINTEVLASLNAAQVAQVEARLDQINALTDAVRKNQFPDAASFKSAIDQALKQ